MVNSNLMNFTPKGNGRNDCIENLSNKQIDFEFQAIKWAECGERIDETQLSQFNARSSHYSQPISRNKSVEFISDLIEITIDFAA